MLRRNIPLILLAGIFCVTNAAFSAEDAVVEAIQYRIKGYVYQRQGDYSKAMENYKKAIERYPFYACACNDLGILYEQLGKIEDAEKQYLKALQIDPDYASVYSNLAMLYERTGNLETAVYYWEKRSGMGNPLDKWTLYAKEKYTELSNVLAAEERFKRDEVLKSSLGQSSKKETKERKDTKKKAPVQVQTQEEQELAEASNLAKIVVLQKQQGFKEAGQRQKQEEACRQYISAANKYIAKGNYDSAIRQYKKVKDINPQYANIGSLIKGAQDAKLEQGHQRKLQLEQDRKAKEEARLKRQQLLDEQKLEREQEKYRNEVEKEQKRLKEERKRKPQADIQPPKQEAQVKPDKQKQKEQEKLKKEQEKLKKQQQVEQKRKLEEQKKEQTRKDKLKVEEDKQRLEKAQIEREKRLEVKAKPVDTARAEKTKQKIATALNKAEDFIIEHKYDSAIKQYQQIEQLDPNYPNIKGLIKQIQQAKLKYEAQKQEEARQERLLKEQEKKRKAARRASFRAAPRASFRTEEKQSKKVEKNAPPKEIEAKQKPKKSEVKTEQKPEKIEIKVEQKPKKIETKKEKEAKEVKEVKKKQEAAKQEKLKKQQEEAKKAEEQKLKEAEKHYKRGQKLYLVSKYQEAAREFELVLVLNPEHVEANRLLRYCQRSTQQGMYRPLESTISRLEPPAPTAAPAATSASGEGSTSGSMSASGQPVKEAPQDIEKRIAQEVKSQEKASSELTAADIERKYQVMGVVAYRSESNDIDKLNEELLKKAKLSGAEEVIQVRYFQHNSFIYGYGTAVKKKK